MSTSSGAVHPACHAGYFVGKVGDFVLFALVLSKTLLHIG
nr:MAG TPA: hypothetical protein [Caudoviricetes sp.]